MTSPVSSSMPTPARWGGAEPAPVIHHCVKHATWPLWALQRPQSLYAAPRLSVLICKMGTQPCASLDGAKTACQAAQLCLTLDVAAVVTPVHRCEIQPLQPLQPWAVQEGEATGAQHCPVLGEALAFPEPPSPPHGWHWPWASLALVGASPVGAQAKPGDFRCKAGPPAKGQGLPVSPAAHALLCLWKEPVAPG